MFNVVFFFLVLFKFLENGVKIKSFFDVVDVVFELILFGGFFLVDGYVGLFDVYDCDMVNIVLVKFNVEFRVMVSGLLV